MSLSYDTKVFITAHYGGTQYWLMSAENQRDNRGRLILQGRWAINPAEAKSMTLELATVYRRRFLEETHAETHFTLNASASAEYVEEPNGSSAQGEDGRVPTAYRGLLARPGIDVRAGTRVWFCKTFDGPMQLEPVRGDSPEEAVNKVFDRGLQDRAEKAPVPQAPQQSQVSQKPAGPRVRPGDLRR
jgi:hypothetical protein